MKCKHTRRAIRSLICGETADVPAIRRHLEECDRCQAKYRPVLAIVRSFEDVPAPRLGEEEWGKFSAELRARIEREQPQPVGWRRALALRLGEWKFTWFRREFAASLAVIALLVSVAVLTPRFWTSEEKPRIVAEKPVVLPAPSPPDVVLPPTAEDAISILGDVGFVTGVISGNIQPGDFIGGRELDAERIIEALDYLLPLS